MAENLQIEQLSLNDVRQMYRTTLKDFQQQAFYFYQKQKGTLTGEELKKALLILTNALIISHSLHGNPKTVLDRFSPLLNNLSSLITEYKCLLTILQPYKETLDRTIQEGISGRKKNNPSYPEILRHGRLYFRIPVCINAKQTIQSIFQDFNKILSNSFKIKLEDDCVLFGSRKQKTGRFLQEQCSQLDKLLTYWEKLTPLQKKSLTNHFENETGTTIIQ